MQHRATDTNRPFSFGFMVLIPGSEKGNPVRKKNFRPGFGLLFCTFGIKKGLPLNAEPHQIALLHGLAKQDRKAVETIYKENFSLIQNLVINNHGSAEDAKDIFQEAMIVLYQKVQS